MNALSRTHLIAFQKPAKFIEMVLYHIAIHKLCLV